MILAFSASVHAQKYSGEIVVSTVYTDKVSFKISYAYNQEFIHKASWIGDSEVTDVLADRQSREKYPLKRDSIGGLYVFREALERKPAEHFSGIEPTSQFKQIGGLKARLYLSHFHGDSVKIWFTQGFGFESGRFVPQKLFSADPFVQILNSDYGFPLEIIEVENKWKVEIRRTKKSLPTDYFEFTKSMNRSFLACEYGEEDPSKPIIYNAIMVNEMPEFPGGHSALQEFMENNLIYTEEMRNEGEKGLISVQFIVQPDGKLSNFFLRRGIGSTMGEEVVLAVKSMPDWIPGKHNGEIVASKIQIVLRFSEDEVKVIKQRSIYSDQ